MKQLRHARMDFLRTAIGCIFLGLTVSGCGVNNSPTLSNRVVGSEGQLFTLDELQVIASDSTLSELEKREAFRELGIEDEKIIDALLQL